jgi:hypothetical protein
VSSQLVEAFGRLVGSLFFVLIVWRFAWQDATGLTRLGPFSVWLLTAAILVYEIATHILPLSGGFHYWTINPVETISVSLNALTTGPLEEIPFRGIILYAFIRLWTNAEEGIVKSVLLSAILFGGSHLIHILFGRPIVQASLIALNASLAGIYYAAIVLRWQTIWPAIALHSLLNTVAAIVAYNTPGFDESEPALIAAILFQVPIVVLGMYLIMRVRPQKIVLYAAKENHYPQIR